MNPAINKLAYQILTTEEINEDLMDKLESMLSVYAAESGMDREADFDMGDFTETVLYTAQCLMDDIIDTWPEELVGG